MCEVLKSLCAKFVHVYKKRERRRRKQRWRLSNHNESRFHQADSLGSDRYVLTKADFYLFLIYFDFYRFMYLEYT